MANIEQVIRHALEKINASNSELREQVYRAAWQSHERNIINDQNLNEEDRTALRDTLIGLIKSIEDGYHIQENDKQSINNEEDSLVLSTNNYNMNETNHPNVIDITTQKKHPHLVEYTQTPHNEINKDTRSPDETSIPPDNEQSVKPEQLNTPSKNHHNLLSYKQNPLWYGNIILIVLLAVLIVVTWVLYSSLTFINRPSNTNNHPSASSKTIKTQQLAPQNDNWITVFDPIHIGDFSIEGAAKAQIIRNGNNTALHLQSTNNASDRVVMNVSAGVMEKLRGKTVTFNIVANSANNQSSQIAITCDFGANDTCGKRVFDLHQSSENLLFSVEIPQNFNKKGHIFLQSDLLGSDYEINILTARVRPEK